MATATMSGDPQGQRGDGWNMQAGVNLLHWLFNGQAACIAPFLRQGMGVNYPGADGLVGLVMILAYGSVTGDRWMLTYFWGWLIAIILRRIESFRLQRRGEVLHSRYTGTPLVLKFRFIKRETTAKNIVEPMLCVVIGALLCPVSEALGQFVMLGAISLMGQRAIESQVNINRVRKMRDLEIEQRMLGEWFRGQRKDF